MTQTLLGWVRWVWNSSLFFGGKMLGKEMLVVIITNIKIFKKAKASIVNLTIVWWTTFSQTDYFQMGNISTYRKNSWLLKIFQKSHLK